MAGREEYWPARRGADMTPLSTDALVLTDAARSRSPGMKATSFCQKAKNSISFQQFALESCWKVQKSK